jgi:hypothetical protein
MAANRRRSATRKSDTEMVSLKRTLSVAHAREMIETSKSEVTALDVF